MNIIATVEQLMHDNIEPVFLKIIDETHKHIHHKEYVEGKYHIAIDIVAPSFAGCSKIECQRLIYKALGELLSDEQAGKLHAVRIIRACAD